MNLPVVFDGHNDVLLRLWLKKSAQAATDFVDGDGLGHMDLPRIQKGRMAGGMFAIFSPSQASYHHDDNDLNPPAESSLAQRAAYQSAVEMLDLRDAIVREAQGAIALCHSAGDVRGAMGRNALAWVTHIEGAEAITPDLANLQMFYDRGLRSLGLVWSRPNAFGDGVPFRFPASPDIGNGLTEAGRDLVKACDALGIIVDVSHLNERGFWDVARLSRRPLVATHSNAHALCASSRNLTNEQLLAIGESKGIVGLNYATGFLRSDGRWDSLTTADTMVRHLDHMIRFAGEDCVGLGSDFDGARIPAFIGGVEGVEHLLAALANAGFGAALIEKIAFKNWLRVLEASLG